MEYSADGQPEFLVGETVTAEAQVHLGNVKPEYVRVQAYFGPVDHGLITGATVQDLKDLKDDGNGNYTYTGRIPASDSGTATAGIKAVRQRFKNKATTRITSPMEMASDF